MPGSSRGVSDEDLEAGGLGPMPGDLSEEGARRRPQGPTRGSADPGPAEAPGAAGTAAQNLDADQVVSGVPRVDALDAGDSGAPTQTLDTQAGTEPGPGARYEGAAGGSGVKVGGQRSRGHAIARGEEQAAAGGPTPQGHEREERDV